MSAALASTMSPSNHYYIQDKGRNASITIAY